MTAWLTLPRTKAFQVLSPRAPTTEPNQTVARVHNGTALIVLQELEDVYVSEGNKADLLYTVANLMTVETTLCG